MFFKKKKSPPTRTIDNFSQLQIGDLVILKYREVLPAGVSGETFTVKSVSTYDYMGQAVADFVLSHSSGLKINACYDSDEEYITFSHKLKHPEIIEIFDGDQLAAIFDPEAEFAGLDLRVEAVSDERRGWLCEKYARTLCEGQAYYYEDDRREIGISKYDDDGSTAFTYHELEGDSDHHSISIEVWEDGETEFFAEVSVSESAVDAFLPNA